MKKGWKRLLSLIVTVVLMLTMLPMTALAATNPMTVTVKDSKGNPIKNAEISASYKFILGGSATQLNDIENNGDGTYTVYRDSGNSGWYNITIAVSAPGYETVTESFTGSTTSKEIVLTSTEDTTEPEPEETTQTPTEPEPEETTQAPTEPEETTPGTDWQEFKLYYYINGNEENPFPDTYAGYETEGNFGPSGDNTPFVTVSVDINKLKNEYSEVAIYQEGANSNQWHFIPGTSSPNLEDAEAFWNAVLDCMSEDSLEALEATGISEWFIGYVLKKMSSWGGGEQHIDGILKVKPPVYSIELYKDTEYVGGLVTNTGEEFKTMSDVLTALEGYLGYTITWEEDENGNPIPKTDSNGDVYYQGAFIENRNLHTITVKQTNTNNAIEIAGSEIEYEKKSSYYYVAYFNLAIQEGQQVEFTVKYTDGDANDQAFYEHSYGVTQGNDGTVNVPPFTGAAVYDDHIFLGWILEGGDGTVLSDAEVQAMPVTQDMVFHAQWKKLFRVVFHTNNENAVDADVFRTYYSDGYEVPADGYALTAQGTVESFYDIPTFAYETHNGYIFAGWYDGTEEDALPIDWNAAYTETTHIYAHWITVGNVSKEDDGKIYERDAYPEYDLLGNQIRTAIQNPGNHYGDAAPGLRFVAALSERVYGEMNALHSNNAGGIEYGFVIAKTTAAQAAASGDAYMLKYKADGINGENNSAAYSYVNNVACRVSGKPVDDHYAGESYRLYTAVITYQNLEGDRLTAAQNTQFIGRAYLRYFDANGLERIHYNNYTGASRTYGGVNTCYTEVQQLVNGL